MRLERILVPVDGSELAERVFPYVHELAGRLGAAVILLRAVAPEEQIQVGTDPVADPTPLVESERHGAEGYLTDLANRLRALGLTVEEHCAEGPPAQAIVERALELSADVIVMSTHARHGLGRLLLGSVADEVLRHAPCPVFLIRASEEGLRAA